MSADIILSKKNQPNQPTKSTNQINQPNQPTKSTNQINQMVKKY